ncbi:GNAT family N-acetyltransferase [Hymenobacter fastidiosus]|uniref:GNAT family N-acetyltransferase n=1 Tax=Hymenobacter fastidiosus TaxID=486264 RepID=A0ABP7RA90_9BACT
MQPVLPHLPYTGTVPILETERLTLRGCQPADFAPFMAMWSEPDFYRFLGQKPLSEEDAWTKMLRTAGHWPLMGFGYWAVEENATGRFLGMVGFSDFKRAIEPSVKGLPEIGWVLAPRAHGQGYATEAVRAALAWGDTHFPPLRTVCIIGPDNRASLRVAEKCGYRLYARTIYKEEPVLLLARQEARL